MELDEEERKMILIKMAVAEFEMATHYASRGKGGTFTDYFGIPYYDNLVQAGVIEKIDVVKEISGKKERPRNKSLETNFWGINNQGNAPTRIRTPINL